MCQIMTQIVLCKILNIVVEWYVVRADKRNDCIWHGFLIAFAIK